MTITLQELADAWARTLPDAWDQDAAFVAYRAGLSAGVELAAAACILTDAQRESNADIARGADIARRNVLSLV